MGGGSGDCVNGARDGGYGGIDCADCFFFFDENFVRHC